MKNTANPLIMSLGLFFGWLLAVPFNGPVLLAFLNSPAYDGPNLSMVFSIAHFLGLFLGGTLIKTDGFWTSLMFWGSVVTLLITALFPLVAPFFWSFFFALLGLSTAVFVLGWSFPYSMGLEPQGRFKTMIMIIFMANIILAILTILVNFINPTLVYYLAAGFLFLVCWRTIPLVQQKYKAPLYFSSPSNNQPLPPAFMLILGLFIFGLYINGGFMYRVMYPSFSNYSDIALYYRLIPYIAVLIIIWHYSRHINRSLPIYLGTSLLGLAFISFSLLAEIPLIGYLLTETLVQSAFAFLDVFVFTLLGDVALFYPPAVRIFGFGLAANVGAIIFGDLMGERLFRLGESFRHTTSLFASAAIFLAFLIYPWLNEKISSAFSHKEKPSLTPVLPLFHMDSKEALTPREIEIIEQILQGLTNKAIAGRLFISESTLKTHIRNIYQKTGVTHKRELISKALKEKNTWQD